MPVTHNFSPSDGEKSPTVVAEYNGVIQAIRSGVENFRSLFRKAMREPEKTRNYLKDREHFSTEVGFLRGRNIKTHSPEERMEACDLLAIEQFPLEKILAATSLEENLRLHEEATYLRNIYHSQIVTLEVGNRKGFEQLRGLPLIEFIRFLTEKVYLAYTQGIVINEQNFEEYLLDDAELRLERIKRDIGHLLKEASMIGSDAPRAFSDFQAAVTALTTKAAALEIDLPVKAPKLYRDRLDRSQKPVEFIEEVYAEWLGKGLLRPHIKALDEPLYRALYKHGIPKSFEERLPKAAGKTGRPRAKATEDALKQRRASDRERSRRLYQKRKHEASLK